MEIEGKVVIPNLPIRGFLDEGKDSLDDSFVDAKEELVSGTSIGTYNSDSLQVTPTSNNMHNMDIERIPSSRKRKTTDSDGRKINPKLAR